MHAFARQFDPREARQTLLLLGLSLLKAIDAVYGLSILVVDAHLIGSIFYRHVLVKKIDQLQALLIGDLRVRSLDGLRASSNATTCLKILRG